MVRLSGINLPNKKRIVSALTAVMGIGDTRSAEICATTKIDPNTKAQDLTEAEEGKLRDEVAKFATEGDLRRQVSANIKTLQDISSYRGSRHKKRLPCRGQKTKTNARTRKGKKKMAIAGKKKV